MQINVTKWTIGFTFGHIDTGPMRLVTGAFGFSHGHFAVVLMIVDKNVGQDNYSYRRAYSWSTKLLHRWNVASCNIGA